MLRLQLLFMLLLLLLLLWPLVIGAVANYALDVGSAERVSPTLTAQSAKEPEALPLPKTMLPCPSRSAPNSTKPRRRR